MARTKKAIAASARKVSNRRVAGLSALTDGRTSIVNQSSNFFSDLYARPAFKYVAGGLAIALAGRLVMKMSGSYPQISSFVKENLDLIEGKLQDFRGIGSADASDRSENARH